MASTPDPTTNESRAAETGSSPGVAEAALARRLSHRRRTGALVDLLADESEHVLAQVRGELTRLGARARPALERAARSDQPRVRSRARQLLHGERRQRALGRLTGFSLRHRHDLETGLWLLDAFARPDVDLRPYRKALDAMAREVESRMARRRPGLRRVLVLAEYLGGEIGFAGPDEDYHHPDHISLGRAIERRTGLPLTLSAVYACVARRAGIETALLPFPGHVLLRIADGGERAIIDPFGGGRVLTERKCLAYLAQNGLPYRGEWFKPASDTEMLARQVRNLINSYRARKRKDLVRPLVRVHTCLDRERPGTRRRLRRIR